MNIKLIFIEYFEHFTDKYMYIEYIITYIFQKVHSFEVRCRPISIISPVSGFTKYIYRCKCAKQWNKISSSDTCTLGKKWIFLFLMKNIQVNYCNEGFGTFNILGLNHEVTVCHVEIQFWPFCDYDEVIWSENVLF